MGIRLWVAERAPLPVHAMTTGLQAPNRRLLCGRLGQQAVLLAPLVAWCAVVSLLSGQFGSLESMLRWFPTSLRPWLAHTDPATHVATTTAVGWCLRKLAHLSEYAVMALLAYRWLSRGSRLRPAAVRALTIAFCVAFAASDEFHQSLVPGRTSAAADVLIDGLGAALAVVYLSRRSRSDHTRRARPQEAAREFDLLLCCAHVTMTEEAVRRARRLLAGILDWEGLLRLAEEHGLVPLLYLNLPRVAPGLVPEAAMQRLQAGYHANARRSLALFAEALRVLPALEAAGITALPLKGPLLADAVYGDVALRECSDLDVLVDPQDVARASQALAALGYRPEESVTLNDSQARALLAYGQHIRFVREEGQAPLELHWRPASFAFVPNLVPLNHWSRDHTASFGKAQIRFPSPEELLVILSLHGYRHLFYSLKWVCDIDELARTYPALDYGQVAARARELRCWRAVLVASLVAADLLGAPIDPGFVTQANADRAASRVAAEITRRLRSGHGPPSRRRDRYRDLWVHLQAVDGLPERVRFFLRSRLLGSPEAVARLPLPPSLLSIYWLASPVGLLQRRGAAVRAAAGRAAARLRGGGTRGA